MFKHILTALAGLMAMGGSPRRGAREPRSFNFPLELVNPYAGGVRRSSRRPNSRSAKDRRDRHDRRSVVHPARTWQRRPVQVLNYTADAASRNRGLDDVLRAYREAA